VYSRHQRKVKLLFALADVLLISLAFAAAYQSRDYLPLSKDFYLTPPQYVALLGASMLLWPVLGWWLQVYERLDSAHIPVVLRDSFKQTALGAIGLVLIEYSIRLDLSRGFVALLAVYSWVILCLYRLNAAKVVGWIRKRFGWPHYVLVVGTGPRARALGQSLLRSSDYGIRLIGFLEDDGKADEPLPASLYPLSELPSLLEKHAISEVIFAVDSQRLSQMEDLLLLCDEDGVRTRVAVDFFRYVNRDVYLDWLESAPLLTFAAAPHDDIRLVAKRLIDLILALAALVFLAPVLGLVAAMVRITSPGPAIFRQIRCGLNGRRFTFYKFRSMVENAEQRKASLAHLNKRRIVFKIAKDPRLTPIGGFLRKFSIDELPQLWNVLRGDMSLVGPRPAVPEEVEQYERWQRRRLRMRPGLTCLWALEGRDVLDFETWMRKDMEYIDNWSLGLDWKILLLTIPRVLTGRGAS